MAKHFDHRLTVVNSLAPRPQTSSTASDLATHQHPKPSPKVTNSPAMAHTDKFPCIHCSEHFPTSIKRAEHIQDVHGSEDVYPCIVCFEYTKTAVSLEHHITTHRNCQKYVACKFPTCEYRHFSPDVLERHLKDDHHSDGSHQPKCSHCDYHNDSLIGGSLHNLHVHSKDAKEDAKRQQLLATKRKRDDEEKIDEDDKQTPNADSLLAKQLADLEALPPKERIGWDSTHRERKRLKKRAAKAADKAVADAAVAATRKRHPVPT